MAVGHILALLLVGIFLYLVIIKNKQRRFCDRFPGPPLNPLFGSATMVFKASDRLKNLRMLQEKYGYRVPLNMIHLCGIFLSHPDDVAKVLGARTINKSFLYDLVFTDWFGQSLFYAKVPRYFKLRKLYSAAFDYNHINKFEIIFNEESQNLVNILAKSAAEGSVVEVRWLYALCAFDIIFQYSTGKRMGFLKRVDNTYALAIHNQLKYLLKRGYSPWLWPSWAWSISSIGKKEKANREMIENFIDKIVQDRKAELESTNFKDGEKLTFLDLLLRAQHEGCEFQDITDNFIRNETTGMIFAGHDTVASTLTFTTFLLASHPEEQVKLHQELDEVFGDDRDKDIFSPDRAKLKHLECCIKESLRLYPPAPFLVRDLTEDVVLDENTTLPEGLQTMVSGWVTHRLPEFFPEPDKFKPERFLPENSVGRHPYSYFPFSGGPRNCMAQKSALANVKTILAKIFRNFRVELVHPPETMIPEGEMVIYPKDGLQIRCIPR